MWVQCLTVFDWALFDWLLLKNRSLPTKFAAKFFGSNFSLSFTADRGSKYSGVWSELFEKTSHLSRNFRFSNLFYNCILSNFHDLWLIRKATLEVNWCACLYKFVNPVEICIDIYLTLQNAATEPIVLKIGFNCCLLENCTFEVNNAWRLFILKMFPSL